MIHTHLPTYEYFGYNSLLTQHGTRIRRLRRTEATAEKIAHARIRSPHWTQNWVAGGVGRGSKSSEAQASRTNSRSKLSFKYQLGQRTYQPSDHQSEAGQLTSHPHLPYAPQPTHPSIQDSLAEYYVTSQAGLDFKKKNPKHSLKRSECHRSHKHSSGRQLMSRPLQQSDTLSRTSKLPYIPKCVNRAPKMAPLAQLHDSFEAATMQESNQNSRKSLVYHEGEGRHPSNLKSSLSASIVSRSSYMTRSPANHNDVSLHNPNEHPHHYAQRAPPTVGQTAGQRASDYGLNFGSAKQLPTYQQMPTYQQLPAFHSRGQLETRRDLQSSRRQVESCRRQLDRQLDSRRQAQGSRGQPYEQQRSSLSKSSSQTSRMSSSRLLASQHHQTSNAQSSSSQLSNTNKQIIQAINTTGQHTRATGQFTEKVCLTKKSTSADQSYKTNETDKNYPQRETRVSEFNQKPVLAKKLQQLVAMSDTKDNKLTPKMDNHKMGTRERESPAIKFNPQSRPDTALCTPAQQTTSNPNKNHTSSNPNNNSNKKNHNYNHNNSNNSNSNTNSEAKQSIADSPKQSRQRHSQHSPQLQHHHPNQTPPTTTPTTLLKEVEEHEMRLGFIYLFVDNTHEAYQGAIQFESYERLCFLMLKKYIYEKSRVIEALRGGPSCFTLSGIAIAPQLLQRHVGSRQVGQKVAECLEEREELLRELEAEWGRISRKYSKDRLMKVEVGRDTFTTEIVKLLMEELTKLYQDLQSEELENDLVEHTQKRITEVIEIMFLLSELTGRPVKHFELLNQPALDFELYYAHNYEKIIETHEYFERLSE